MGESSIAGLAQIFRTGWAVRGTLTIFDYVIGSERMSQQAGKVVSNWHSKAGDTILGGRYPMFPLLQQRQIQGHRRDHSKQMLSL